VFLARPRVKLFVNGLQTLPIHMGVVLCGLNIGVTEKFLHGAKIGAAGKQVRGEAVPERMRANAGVETGALDVFLDKHPEHLSSQRFAAAADEEPGRLRRGAY